MDLKVFKEILQSLGKKYIVFKDVSEQKLLYPFKVNFCNDTSDYSIICDSRRDPNNKVKDIFSSNFLVTAEQMLKLVSDSAMRIPPDNCKISVENSMAIYDIGGLTYQDGIAIIYLDKLKKRTKIYDMYE